MIRYLIAYFFRFALWFRYRIKVKGLENLNKETLNKPGGVLFLPNHPAIFIDPVTVTLSIFPKFIIRPMIVEYFYYMPVVNSLMKLLDALPVPNFVTSSNSLKKNRSEKVIQTVIQDLRKGQNFLLYPAGKTKFTNYEAIGGASATHRIIEEVPEANIVLVRTKGLWGSSFSRAITGSVPNMYPTIFQGIKKVFKNLLFFTPRREITIELIPAPADFPYKASRLEMNKWLEVWYNQPDGLTKQEGKLPGDSLMLVSYSRWGQDVPAVYAKNHLKDAKINLNKIPQEIQNKIIQKLSAITEYDPANIKPEMTLAADLGLDSLDMAEVVVYLQDEFSVDGVPVSELGTVAMVMAIAAKTIVVKDETEEEEQEFSAWKKPVSRTVLKMAPGDTIPEVFLNNCERLGSALACGDARSGILNYKQLKMRAILLARHIKKYPGEYIGVLLPASVAAYVTVLAIQMAGKVPLLVNWTTGSRHLQSIVEQSKVQIVLSSWAFLDRLENVNFEGIEDKLVMLEDVRGEITLKDKIKAFLLSKKSPKAIAEALGINHISPESNAVLLFTSGTENVPKGVPLTHKNILSNQRAIYDTIEFYSDDVLLGILPPFHAFGFTVTGLLPLMGGIKVAFSPDPTDGKRLSKAAEKWNASILCGAPTFLKGIFKMAQPEQLKRVRMIVSGAEKAPKELFSLAETVTKNAVFLEGYGITECSPILTANLPGEPHVGVGRPIKGVEACIVSNETGERMPQGQQGMIMVRGPNIFNGYLSPGINSPFVMIEGQKWYKTGDLGIIDQQGFLTITGRLKRFIKIGAEMVSLASIEDALLEVAQRRGWELFPEGPSLAICAKEQNGDKPKIYLFTKFLTNIDEVNRSLKESGFSNLVKVSAVYQLSDIPIMGTGKVNYRSLEGLCSDK
jgi:long-chain-fatty-acid--[acyl-carrier-protein] ligase